MWQSLLARNGELERFGIVHVDSEYGKRRYGVELDFSERKMMALVVFEPAGGEIIGLFFLSAQPREPPAGPCRER